MSEGIYFVSGGGRQMGFVCLNYSGCINYDYCALGIWKMGRFKVAVKREKVVFIAKAS